MGEYVGGWPDDYLAFDCETNGLANSPLTVPTQIGWVYVSDGVVVARDAPILDWTRPGCGLPPDDLQDTLARTTAAMRSQGHVFPFTWGYLEAHGRPPRDVVDEFVGMVADAVAAGIPIVGFNAWAFDVRVVSQSAARFGLRFDLPAESLLDVMLVERFRMAAVDYPTPGLSRALWYGSGAGASVKCGLFNHCAPTYGVPIDHRKAHDAGYDAEVSHLVCEAMAATAYGS